MQRIFYITNSHWDQVIGELNRGEREEFLFCFGKGALATVQGTVSFCPGLAERGYGSARYSSGGDPSLARI